MLLPSKSHRKNRFFACENLEPRRLLAASGLFDQSTKIADVGLDPRTDVTGTPAIVVGSKIIFETEDSALNVYDPATGHGVAMQVDNELAAATTVGTEAIFAGGYVPQGSVGIGSDLVEIYDSAADQWSTAHLSQGRGDLAAVTVGNKALFAGGWGEFSPGGFLSPSSVVDIYDASTGAWTTTAMPTLEIALHAAAVGSKAIFVSAENPLIQIYDTATGQWSSHLGSSSATSAISVGSKVVVVGSESVVDIYDSSNDSWSTAPLSQARARFSAAVVGDRLILAGGVYIDVHHREHPSLVVDVFDADTGNWSTSVLPQPLATYFNSPALAATLGQRAIFIGDDNALEAFDPNGGQWATGRLSGAETPVVTVALGDAVYAVGSSNPSNSSDIQADVLTDSGLAAPSDPRPADGASVPNGAVTLRWSATPGASGYDLYFDGQLLKSNISMTRFPAVGVRGGNHTWQVVAHVAGGTVAGPEWTFAARAPRLETALDGSSLGTSVTPGGRPTVTVLVTNKGNAVLESPFRVTLTELPYKLPFGMPYVLGATIVTQPLAVGATVSIEVPLSFAIFSGIRGQHRIALTATVYSTGRGRGNRGRGGRAMASVSGGLLLIRPV